MNNYFQLSKEQQMVQISSDAASFCIDTATQGTIVWIDNNNKIFGEVFPKEK
jgi:hypothetical protein